MLDLSAIEAEIAERMAATRTPGVALAVVRDGEVVAARGFGVTSVEEAGGPVTPGTLFQIGSTTKPLTGMAVMRLVDDGLLHLDRPVVAWLPELRLDQPGAAERVTLRMLLGHTAGLPWDQITPHRLFGRRDPRALADWVRDELPARPLVAPPGCVFSYSNPGISLAARVAEVAAGLPYPRLVCTLVCEPLEMRRTTLDPTVAMTWPLAQSHDLDETGAPRVQHRIADNAPHYPAAFAFSCALDLANFALMHLHSGRFAARQVLSAGAVAAMQAPQVDRYAGPGTGYGLTLFVDDWRGVRRIGHPGGINNYGCEFAMVPAAGAAVVLLFNHGGFAPAATAITNTILAGLLDLPEESPPQPITPDTASWPLYAGRYRREGAEATIRITTDGLVLDLEGAECPLTSLRDDLYTTPHPTRATPLYIGFPPACEAGQFMVVGGAVYSPHPPNPPPRGYPAQPLGEGVTRTEALSSRSLAPPLPAVGRGAGGEGCSPG